MSLEMNDKGEINNTGVVYGRFVPMYETYPPIQWYDWILFWRAVRKLKMRKQMHGDDGWETVPLRRMKKS